MTDNSTVSVATTDSDPSLAPLAAHAPVRPDSPAFSDFDIQPEIVAALADVGITNTFAIQELTLPIALAGQDLIGQARTGTGKTLGFGVPLLNRLALPGGDAAAPQALVVAPTRELAVQVSADLAAAGKPDRRPGAHHLRRPRLRAADRRAAQGRRRRRRHPGAAARPGPAGPSGPRQRRAPWCWTRPTRCSTSASCPTSRSC